MALELAAARARRRAGAKSRDADKAFGDDWCCSTSTRRFLHGERVGVVGPTARVRTVLLRAAAGKLAPDVGEVWRAEHRFGYYAQQHETLDPARTPVENGAPARPMYEEQAVALLGRFLFRYDSGHAAGRGLSGGEKSRPQLLLLMLAGANCLLLDEPTNHLDIASAEVLEGALDDSTAR